MILFGIFIEYVGHSRLFLNKLNRIKIFPVKLPSALVRVCVCVCVCVCVRERERNHCFGYQTFDISA